MRNEDVDDSGRFSDRITGVLWLVEWGHSQKKKSTYSQ